MTLSTVPAGAAPDLADVAARLGALLHAAGVPVTPERSGRLAATLALAMPATGDELYWIARITLLADHAHIEVFDRVFSQIFGGMVDPADFRGDQAPPPAAGCTGRVHAPTSGGPTTRRRRRCQEDARPAVLGDDGGDDAGQRETSRRGPQRGRTPANQGLRDL